MAVQLDFPENGAFSFEQFVDIIDFVTIRATVSGITSTGFTGSGSFEGGSATFTASGSGFSLGTINNSNRILTGTVDTIVFNSGGNQLTMSNTDIDMSEFGPIIAADDFGQDLDGIETFLMNLDWVINFGDGDDEAARGTRVGDNVSFNLRGNDQINAGGGDDDLFSGHGRDTLKGESGHDTLNGGVGNDLVNGGSGADSLIGGSGRDRLFGGSGKDTLSGGSGNDRLLGGNQKDTLNGGGGNDELTGGRGSDIFVFKNGSGRDVITDFNATSNGEKIDLSDVTNIRNFRDLSRNHMEVDGDDVVISAGRIEIRLEDVDINDLGRGDFLF